MPLCQTKPVVYRDVSNLWKGSGIVLGIVYFGFDDFFGSPVPSVSLAICSILELEAAILTVFCTILEFQPLIFPSICNMLAPPGGFARLGTMSTVTTCDAYPQPFVVLLGMVLFLLCFSI